MSQHPTPAKSTANIPLGFHRPTSFHRRALPSQNRPPLPPPPPPPPPPPLSTFYQPTYGQSHQFLYNFNGAYCYNPPQPFSPALAVSASAAHRHPSAIVTAPTRTHPTLTPAPPPPPPPPNKNSRIRRASLPSSSIAAAAANVTTTTTTKKHIFRCSPCNLTFDSHEAWTAHTASHIQCTVCAFRGSPKAVKGHYHTTHGKFAVDAGVGAGTSGGGFKTVTVAVPGCPPRHYRICVGNRPEDIAAWIAERRQRFPRVSRLHSNARSSLSLPISSTSSSLSPVKQDPQNPLLHESHLRNNRSTCTSTSGDETNSLIQSPPSSTAIRCATTSEVAVVVPGLSSLLCGYGSSSSSDDDDDDEKSIGKKFKEETNNAVSATNLPPTHVQSPPLLPQSEESQVRPLAATTSSIEAPLEHVPVVTNMNQQARYPNKRPCLFWTRNGTCRNGDACRFAHDSTIRAHSKHYDPAGHTQQQQQQQQHQQQQIPALVATGRPRHQERQPQRHPQRQRPRPRPSSLLEKLLENDRKRERVLTIQLLSYIVDTQFLTATRKTTTIPTTRTSTTTMTMTDEATPTAPISMVTVRRPHVE